MITGIRIPMDEAAPIERVEINAEDVSVMQTLVGGTFEVINMIPIKTSIFLNDEGKLMELPLNRRATLLLWLHVSNFRGQDHLVGDVVLTGLPGRTGRTKAVPKELLSLLFGTANYHVEVLTEQFGKWRARERDFTEWVDAYDYALQLAAKWPTIKSVRVMPVS